VCLFVMRDELSAGDADPMGKCGIGGVTKDPDVDGEWYFVFDSSKLCVSSIT